MGKHSTKDLIGKAFKYLRPLGYLKEEFSLDTIGIK
jgi:hypothetical protein